MNRREQLLGLLAGGAALAGRKYFLAPKGGWLSRYEYGVDVSFTSIESMFRLDDFQERILLPAIMAIEKQIDAEARAFYAGTQWPKEVIAQREYVIAQAGEPIDVSAAYRFNRIEPPKRRPARWGFLR